MQKIYNVLLDTKDDVKNPAFVVNTNDLKTVKINLLINQDGDPLDLTGATVRLAVKKPDKTTVLQDITVVDALAGSCEIVLNTQAYVIDGKYDAEVMVYYGVDTVAVTGQFSYRAVKGILDDGSVESTNEWQSINQAIADAEGILIDLRDNGTGVDAQARADIASQATQIAEKAAQTDLNTTNGNVTENTNHLKSQYLNVKYPFGTGLTALKGDGSNEQATFLAILNYAKNNLPITLFFPNGVYGVTDLGNLAYKNLTFEGATDRGVVFKCLNTVANHTAFNFDAFWAGVKATGFVQRCNVKNIIFEGNSETFTIVNVQGIARSSWENVYARNGKTGDATNKTSAFYFRGVMLSHFKNIMCSTQIDSQMGALVPYYGIYFDRGLRGTEPDTEDVGHSSNNTFINAYFEGMSEGMRLAKADQNVFVGGSPESCTINGVYIFPESMYNTFIGTGFENPAALTDVDDGGLSTQFINCYSSKYMKLRGQHGKISGGLFANIEIMAAGVKNFVEFVKVRHFGGTTGFVDGGTATKWHSIFDEMANGYVYPHKPRTSITVSASPFTYTNNTDQMIQLFVGGGTVTGISTVRNGGDPYTLPATTPAMFTLAPKDGVTVTYSVAPSMSQRILNGF